MGMFRQSVRQVQFTMLRMKWVPLYVLTALVTGLHNLYGLMAMVNGAPLNLLNAISLLGSMALMVAAVLVLFRLRTASKVGVLGSMLCWVYYAPLIVASLIAPFSTWREIRFDFSFHDYVPLVGRLLAPILLILCTANSIALSKRNRAVSQSHP